MKSINPAIIENTVIKVRAQVFHQKDGCVA